jgi:hypothetical protein
MTFVPVSLISDGQLATWRDSVPEGRAVARSVPTNHDGQPVTHNPCPGRQIPWGSGSEGRDRRRRRR